MRKHKSAKNEFGMTTIAPPSTSLQGVSSPAGMSVDDMLRLMASKGISVTICTRPNVAQIDGVPEAEGSDPRELEYVKARNLSAEEAVEMEKKREAGTMRGTEKLALDKFYHYRDFPGPSPPSYRHFANARKYAKQVSRVATLLRRRAIAVPPDAVRSDDDDEVALNREVDLMERLAEHMGLDSPIDTKTRVPRQRFEEKADLIWPILDHLYAAWSIPVRSNTRKRKRAEQHDNDDNNEADAREPDQSKRLKLDDKRVKRRTSKNGATVENPKKRSMLQMYGALEKVFGEWCFGSLVVEDKRVTRRNGKQLRLANRRLIMTELFAEADGTPRTVLDLARQSALVLNCS